MSQSAKAIEMRSCMRCGAYSGSEALCLRCREQEYAQQHALPRVVWQAQGYRLVQYLDEEDGHIRHVLECRDGRDYLGQERWRTVSNQGAPADGWGFVARDWHYAFGALTRYLFLPPAIESGSVGLAPLIVGEEADADEAAQDAWGDEEE